MNCRGCDTRLVPGQNWYPSRVRKQDYICNKCHQARTWRYHQEHADTVKVRKAKHRRANRPAINTYRAKKYATDPEYREQEKARAGHQRARRRGADGSHTPAQFRQLCRQTGNRCLRCGAAGGHLTEDHIVPLSKGGSNDIDNIQPLCRSCNSSKGAQTTNYIERGAQPCQS